MDKASQEGKEHDPFEKNLSSSMQLGHRGRRKIKARARPHKSSGSGRPALSPTGEANIRQPLKVMLPSKPKELTIEK